MTLEETAQVMDILTAAYPQFYRGKNAPDPEQALLLWASMFDEEDAVVVAAAVKALIATDEKGYPPHIGAVKARIRQITTPQSMSAGEAWALVSKALRKSAYNSAEEFKRLPPELQSLVGTPGQLRDWALMEADVVQSVVASNIQKVYRERTAEAQRYAALPGDVKRLMDGIAGKLNLNNLAAPEGDADA